MKGTPRLARRRCHRNTGISPNHSGQRRCRNCRRIVRPPAFRSKFHQSCSRRWCTSHTFRRRRLAVTPASSFPQEWVAGKIRLRAERRARGLLRESNFRTKPTPGIIAETNDGDKDDDQAGGRHDEHPPLSAGRVKDGWPGEYGCGPSAGPGNCSGKLNGRRAVLGLGAGKPVPRRHRL